MSQVRRTIAQMNAEASKYPEMECYKIEENVAPPTWGGRGLMSQERYEKMKVLMIQFNKVGMSCVIKTSDKSSLQRVLKSEFPEYKIRISKIIDNPIYCRIYRLA